MTRLRRTLAAEAADAARLSEPRDDCLVLEEPTGPGRFAALDGPFRDYERTLEVGPDGSVVEEVRFRLAVGVWPFVFAPLYRRGLRRRWPAGRSPWWAPAERIDATSAGTLGLLCVLAVITGYLGTLITQTITFAVDEFGASDRAQGATLAAVRVGVLGAVALTALADRRGRRRALLGSVAAACAFATLGAVSTNLVVLGVGQTISRGFTTAAAVLVAVVGIEEMRASSRAYAASLLAMAGALGVGTCLWVLPLADLGERAWRLLYLFPLAALLPLRWIARHLPESRRFTAPHGTATMGGHARRFWLLAASGLLLGLFTAPASQFMNDFLREERGFSALQITVFAIATNTPGGIGVIVGGRLADLRGRRTIGAVGVVAGTVLTAGMLYVHGWPMWALSVAGAVLGAMTVPALGVYGPELFPTSLRGRANGIIAVAGVAGSSTGLLLAGWFSDRWGRLAPGLTVLAAGPLLMAVLVRFAYPETAHVELEELNPEDRAGPAAGAELP
ncbi:MAG: MFS transporter [Acidimicrobiia bacterium]